MKNKKGKEMHEPADMKTSNGNKIMNEAQEKESAAADMEQPEQECDEAAQLEKKTAELEEQLKNMTDKHLRLQAEFDNFRKRTLKEKAELIKFGGESVLTGILPVIDDFERAIQSLQAVPENDPGKQGTILIYNKFKDFLKQNSVQEIDALNQDFDVDHHEAVTKIPANEEKLKGKVVDIIQKGYMLNDKVIRFAKVVVGE
ncbi:MAG: nucleotide exchange factor GrpE [Mariniphaga sp.]|nr:nucleotide exchange factor GrpE [Mariniphaga sp.]MDD4226403.1 nucleotide exchange factor GrpE [Mariniphaga sp.]